MPPLTQHVRGRSSEERQLRAVLDALPIALLLIDQSDTIRYANERAAVLFGHAPGAMEGAEMAGLLPGALNGLRPRLGMAPAPLRSARPGCDDQQACGRDGDTFPVEVLTNALRLDGQPHLVVAVNDLREKRRAEQEMATERESMAHMSRVTLVGEISGSLAHELNQPLAAILSNAQAALRILRRDPGEIADIREILEDIVENDRRAGEVISRLRGLLRRECRSFGTLVVNDLVHDALRIMRNDLINRSVEYRLDLTVDSCRVHGDPVQLQQVLLNLIINACDAMGEQTTRVLTLRTIVASPGFIRIEVCDTGIGIDPDRLEDIFAPFQTTKPHGMGMGLAICRTLLGAHKARIWARNQSAGGACVCVELPLQE